MVNGCFRKTFSRFCKDRSGITGLETAIVLIAFVVVAAVFAFTVLTTGLFTSEKAKETALAGVATTSSSMTIKGNIIAQASTGATPVVEVIREMHCNCDEGLFIVFDNPSLKCKLQIRMTISLGYY